MQQKQLFEFGAGENGAGRADGLPVCAGAEADSAIPAENIATGPFRAATAAKRGVLDERRIGLALLTVFATISQHCQSLLDKEKEFWNQSA
jgi:hypothetical protein